jgi:phosphoribosylglycinamide formyltransferase-1
VVAQAVVPVLPGDDEASLSARVLAQEHRMYPRAVRWFVHGELRLDGERVLHTGGELQAFGLAG